MRWLVSFGLLLGLLLCFSQAAGQVSAPGSSASTQPSPAQKRTRAKAHFDKGVQLSAEQAWDAALAEFLASRRLYPTQSATKNAAVCYRHLHRFAEALDMFETLLREFPKLSQKDREVAERAIKKLRGLVGTIALRDVEPGARIVVDGRDLGTWPLKKPIRVSAGSHIIRVYKAGFVPFETRIDVAAEATVISATMQVLTQSGRLKVVEQTGRALEVVVDNIVVGRTPWEGAVSEGPHTVFLRGDGQLGTQPVSAEVIAYQPTNLSLLAERLTASLRIEPNPRDATVLVDTVSVGKGIWEGRLRPGRHQVEITAEGFIATKQEVSLAPDRAEVLTFTLKRDRASGFWEEDTPAGKFTLELDGAYVIAPSFGGDLNEQCDGTCSSTVGRGGLGMLRGSFEFNSGFSLGLSAGYFAAVQKIYGRAATLTPVGWQANSGSVSDLLRVDGALVGAHAGYHLGDRFPVLFRLGIGGLFGRLRDERNGQFATSSGSVYETNGTAASPSIGYLYIAPEVRAGVRLGEGWELSAVVAAYILVGLNTPEWDSEQVVVAAEEGYSQFGEEQLAGNVLVAIAPGLGVRYAF